ncbi:hypothetical protein Desde_0825 [Desulfitobacterium dehalogenans ATCC 51507]|uniref:Uncharacterized protein n=1 Tax=Desulfitobacterium dehalogenans (strain ATCC 51507 / DSM 9161 / JW/IU-DC1) TaxID=756499 RepID=I4A5N6_DESDJ|nr:hypothetical protein [Desulfitobacterium dehalogenans]AFL99270.1 hypothetical protein Desde_0825 [Desulfitobacterium dehalogenans ATCC 51507]
MASELKGYYKPLVASQCSLNKDDIDNQEQYAQAIISGNEAALKYYFQIDSKVYYVLRDVLYSREGLEIIALQPKSEGYFTNKDNLYYVYGYEKEKKSNTLGGPVYYTLKDYKYRKIDLSTNKEIEVTKDEYEALYFNLENELAK